MRGVARAGSSSREAGGSIGIVCIFLFDPFRLQSHVRFKLIHMYAAADSISPRPSHILLPLVLGRLLVELYEGTGPNEHLTFCCLSWFSAEQVPSSVSACGHVNVVPEVGMLSAATAWALAWLKTIIIQYLQMLVNQQTGFFVVGFFFFNVSIGCGFPTLDTRSEVQ